MPSNGMLSWCTVKTVTLCSWLCSQSFIQNIWAAAAKTLPSAFHIISYSILLERICVDVK